MIVGFGGWNGLSAVDYAASMNAELRTRIKELTKLENGSSPFSSFDSNNQSPVSFVPSTGMRWKNTVQNGVRMGYGSWTPNRIYGGAACKRVILGVCLARDGSSYGHPVVLSGNFPQEAGGFKTGYLSAGTSATGNVFVEVVIDYGTEVYVSVYYNGTLTLKVRMSNISSIMLGSLNASTDINGSAISPFLRPELNGLLEFKQWYYAVNYATDEGLDEPRGAFYVGQVSSYGREEGDSNGATPSDIAVQLPIVNSTLPYTSGISSPRITLAAMGGESTDFRLNSVGLIDINIIALGTRTLGVSAISGLNSSVAQTITVGDEVKKSTSFVPLTSTSVQGNYQTILELKTPKASLAKGEVKVTYSSAKVV